MKKIFVTKQGGLGDVLLATPAIAEIKRVCPDSFITLLTFPNARELVDGLPFIDEVFVYDKDSVSFFSLWKKFLGYDVAIFLDLTYRPAMAAALARVPVRVGLRHKRKIWLTKAIEWQEYMDHTFEPYVMGEIVETALDTKLDRQRLMRPYAKEATQEERENLQRELSAHGLAPGDGYIVSSPVTAYFLKNWPLSRWNELYKKIHARYGVKTVVFGGGASPYAFDEEAVVNLWGVLNLRQVGELIKNASLLVNSCSMPEHLAAAFGTPCVILFGFGDEERWKPRNGAIAVNLHLPCSPCDGYHGSKCQDPRCMKELSLDTVFDACERQLDACLC